MREYFPDRWVLLKIEGSKVPKTYYRVLASWYGGYCGSNSWQMSSGVESIAHDPIREIYSMPQNSGSVYRVRKSSYGMSAHTAGVYKTYADQNTDGCRISIVDENFDIAGLLPK